MIANKPKDPTSREPEARIKELELEVHALTIELAAEHRRVEYQARRAFAAGLSEGRRAAQREQLERPQATTSNGRQETAAEQRRREIYG